MLSFKYTPSNYNEAFKNKIEKFSNKNITLIDFDFQEELKKPNNKLLN